MSETWQNSSGQVKCRYMVIRRTCQFFDCNLKLGLLRSRRDSSGSLAHPMADTDDDDVSLAGVLQRQLVAQYVACLPYLGDNTRFLVSGLRRVSNLQASREQFLPSRADVRLSDIRLSLETLLKLSTEWPRSSKGPK